MKQTRPRKKIPRLLILLIFLLGIGMMSFPFVSDFINQRIQSELIVEHSLVIDELTPEQKQAELDACFAYNNSLLGELEFTDPFNSDEEVSLAEAYEARLNVGGNGIMGYIDIPKIDVHLAIYHGTTTESLDKGVGHFENTSLPIGGASTHCVLAAHTAYSKAVYFDNLTKLELGDMFSLTVLGDQLVYRIDHISVVEPGAGSDLIVKTNEDYVTLVTCTPYGINTHRLLVRGKRTLDVLPDDYEDGAGIPLLPLMLGASVMIVLVAVVVRARRKATRKTTHEN